ncbi:MAG: hypothetical protein ACETWG_12840, partial [Candidatus Neomarinimicrobiota bacterium]
DGVRGASLGLMRRTSRAYGLKPTYSALFEIGSYDVYDSTYAPHLFNPGQTTYLTTALGVQKETLVWEYEYTLMATAGAPTIGDYDFTRLTLEFRAGRSLGPARLNFRSLAGGIWSTTSIPSQERFTVAAASSMEYYHRPYLSAEGSLYGLPPEVQKHYHLPGDGNLRGYYDHDYFGVEGLLTTTTELTWPFSFGKVGTLGASLFLDGALLWGDRLEVGDQDFDGDFLMDAGFGLEWSKRLFFGQTFYFRVDLPFYVNVPEEDGSEINFRWVFSFQRGL